MGNAVNMKTVLIRKYHTLCSRLGLDEATRQGILAQYGAESSKDLSVKELTNVIVALCNQLITTPEDRARKRVIGAAISYLESQKEGFVTWTSFAKVEYAKGAAVKAAGLATTGADIDKAFNEIPLETLVKISAMFNNKVKNNKDN